MTFFLIRLFPVFVLSMFNGLCFSQSVRLDSKQHLGFIIPHRTGVENLIHGHVKATELTLEKGTYGEKYWQEKWRYPRIGVALYYADLANPKQLGSSLALFPYIKFRAAGGERIRFNLRVGGGLGYITRIFDIEDNYKNVMIGSHLNIIANLVGEAEFDITKRLSLSAGLGFMHYSNGAFKIPNLGINIPSINTGLSYRFGQEKVRITSDSILAPSKYQGIVFGTFGLKENYPVGGVKYPVYALTGEVSRLFGHRSKMVGMLDVFYNTSIRQGMRRDGVTINSDLDIMQVGFMLGYGAVIDRLTITVGQGVYMRTKYKGDSHFYHRMGVSYLATKKIALRWMLKTHFFKADSFEFGIGYRFL